MAAVAATVRLEGGACADARVVASAVGARPARLEAAEEALVGGPADATRLDAAAEAARGAVDPPSDSHADAAYRRDAIGTLTRRTLRRAVSRCATSRTAPMSRAPSRTAPARRG